MPSRLPTVICIGWYPYKEKVIHDSTLKSSTENSNVGSPVLDRMEEEAICGGEEKGGKGRQGRGQPW